MMRTTITWLIIAVALAAFSFGVSNPSPTPRLVKPINMTIDDDRLFISDRVTGVHMYDIADPAKPVRVMTIPLAGNRGSAVKDDILYANDYGSLFAIRIGVDNTYEVVKTVHGEREFVDQGVMDEPVSGFFCYCSVNQQSAVAPQSAGSGGSSFATFAVIGDYLYYLDHRTLVTADISTADDPRTISRASIGWDIETLYPTEDYLFVGGTRGMYIFDRSDPTRPVEIGRIEHFQACDPVVVSDDIAYVTLRSGNGCGAADDVMLCVDVKDPSKPVVLEEKQIKTPYGLAVNSPLLYVSNGHSGYELYDVSSPGDPSHVESWAQRPTKDFIWSDQTLYTLTFDGLLIFDVSDPKGPVLLSEIRAESDN